MTGEAKRQKDKHRSYYMSRIKEKFEQLTSTTKAILLGVFLVLIFACLFRYSAPVHTTRGVVAVTDRWTGCVVWHVFLASDKKGKKMDKTCP
jgi:hypothetical protein